VIAAPRASGAVVALAALVAALGIVASASGLFWP
jgi:hypothetical protein